MIKKEKKTIYICDQSGLAVASDTLPVGWCRVNEVVDGQGVIDESVAIHISSKKLLKDYTTKEGKDKETKALKKYYGK